MDSTGLEYGRQDQTVIRLIADLTEERGEEQDARSRVVSN